MAAQVSASRDQFDSPDKHGMERPRGGLAGSQPPYQTGRKKGPTEREKGASREGLRGLGAPAPREVDGSSRSSPERVMSPAIIQRQETHTRNEGCGASKGAPLTETACQGMHIESQGVST